MNFLRGVAVILGTTAISVFLLLGIVALSLNLTFGTPSNLKHWLVESKVYDNIVQAAIESSVNSKNAKTVNADDFARPEVQAALKASVSPTFLQNAAETFLDGTYKWLSGKTAKPEYAIDLTRVKANFAEHIATTARNRLASLPPCTITNQPTTTDPFTINCRPPTSVSEPQIQKLVDDIVNGKVVSADTITADTQDINKPTDQAGTTVVAQPKQQAWYIQLKSVPSYYSWTMRAPYILALLTLLSGVLVVFTTKSRRAGMMVVAGTSLTVGVFLVVGAEASLWMFKKLGESVAQNKSTPSLQQPMSYLVHAVGHSIAYTQLWGGVVITILSFAALVALYVTKPKTPREEAETSVAPTPQAPAPEKKPTKKTTPKA